MRRESLCLFVVFLAAVALRVVPLDHQALWADELFSLAMATGHSLEHPAGRADPSVGDYVEAPEPLPAREYRRYLEHERPPAGPRRVARAVLLSDTSPPLYYEWLWAWTRAFGTSDAAVRFSSLLWALASLPLLWLVANRIGGRGAAVVACLLFAASPQCLHYSLEVRMYSLTWFLGLALAWFTLELHSRGNHGSLAIPWVLVVAAGLLTHYFFGFVVAACAAWLLRYPGKSRRASLVAYAFAAALLVIPWYGHLPQSLSSWRVTQDWLYHGEHRFRATLELPWILIASGRNSAVYPRADRAILALVALLALVLGWRRAAGLFSKEARLLWLWLLASCAGILTFDLGLGSYASTVPRYAMPGLPAALLLLALGMSRLPRRVCAVFAFALITAWLPALAGELTREVRSGEPYAGLAAMADQMNGKADVVLVHSIPAGVAGIARYMQQSPPMLSWVSQLKQRRVPEDLERLAARFDRILLVRVHPVTQDEEEERWLLAHAKLVETRRLNTARIRVFETGAR